MYVEPVSGLHYQQYTRDLGKMTGEGVLFGRFKWSVRQGETSIYEKFFVNQGISIFSQVSKGFFERGDVHYMDNETVACGLADRSDKESMELKCNVVAIDAKTTMSFKKM